MKAAAFALALACAAVALGAPSGGAPSAEAQGCPGVTVRSGVTGTWTTLPIPKFPVGDAVVERHAIDPNVPGRWYITNGKAIMVSEDAGCSWRAAYVLPETPTADQPFDQTFGDISRIAAAGNRVVATIRVDAVDVPVGVNINGEDEFEPSGTFVMRSEDGGNTWARGTEALPPVGSEGPLVVAPSDPKIVYLGLGGDVHRSSDGGRTFTRLQSPVVGNLSINALVVDPQFADVLWLMAGSAFRTTDGGQTWKYYAPDDAGDFTAVGPALNHPADGKPARVVFTEGDPVDAFFVSDNDGESFEKRGFESFGEVKGKAISIAGGTARNDILLSTQPGSFGGGGHGIYRWSEASGKLLPIDEFRLAPLDEIQVAAGAEGKFYMHAPRLLVVHEGPKGGPAPAPPPPAPAPTRPGGSEDEEAPPLNESESPAIKDDPLVGTLAPDGGTIAVPPGDSATVDYKLTLPSRTARLDTFFLLDTSGSTEPYIRELSNGIDDLARLLESNGTDAWFGLGEYQDAHALKYRRRSDLRPPDEAFHQALDTINTNGGAEPGYTAIHQAATGSGILDPSTGNSVPPGRNANWRRGSARTIVHFADEVFSADPDGASADEALAALKERNISFIGIVVSDVAVPVPSGTVPCDAVAPLQAAEGAGGESAVALRCQLERLAAGTNTVGPPGGFDCNGDGIVDVPEGKPMVCVITPGDTTGLGPLSKAVENLLLAVKQERAVVLEAEGPTEVGVDVTPMADYSKVDLHKENALDFDVRFSCTKDQAGHEYPAALVARIEDRKVARAQPTIRCGELPPPPPAPPEPPEAPAPQPQPQPAPQIAIPPVPVNVFAVAPMPPPPPPALASSVQVANATAPAAAQATAPASANAPASSPAIAPQGMAAQEQEQVNVTPVTVSVDAGDGETVTDYELSFSHADQATEAGHWPWFARLFGIAAVLAGAAAALPRRQTNTQTRRLDR